MRLAVRLAAAERAGLIVGVRRVATAATGGKAFATAEEAVKDIPTGAKLLVGGFGLTGVPENLLRAIDAGSAGEFTVVSSNVGTAEEGLGPLFASKKIAKVVGSYVGENDVRHNRAPRCVAGTVHTSAHVDAAPHCTPRSSSSSF